MTKKKEYKLFGKTVRISDWDVETLSYHLQNWDLLYDFMTNGLCNEDALIKMIIIEREGQSRSHIITRIHSKMTTMRRDAQRKELGI